MKTTSDKLKAYSTAAGAFILLSSNAVGQVIYTDLIPDVVINGNDIFPIDLNDDGFNEMEFKGWSFETWTSFGGSSEGYTLQQIYLHNFASMAFTGIRPMFLPEGTVINTLLPFTTEINLNIFYATYDVGGYLDVDSGGSWINTDGFIGVKFNISGETHFGWVRVNIREVPDGGMPDLIIKDFAYNAVADEQITTSLYSASPPQNLILNDVGETNTATDLQLNFEKAANENTVSAYRIILYTGGIPPTLDEANALSPDRYTEVLPEGVDISLTFDATTHDIEGNILSPDTYYRAIVLSVADGVEVETNELSFQSNQEKYSIYDAPYASYLNLVDNQIDQDISAFTVSFASYYSGVSEFKIYIADSNNLTIEELESLDSTYFTKEIPFYGWHTVPTDISKKIYTSDEPALFEKYYAYAISEPDFITSSFPSLSISYSEYFLYPNLSIAPLIDNSNLTGTVTDINIQFPKFENENLLIEYMIVFVKTGEEFTNTDAAALTFSRSTHIEPSGSDLNVNLPETAKDNHGSDLDIGKYYNAYVVLKGDVYPEYFTVSAPSDSFTLTAPVNTEDILPELLIYSEGYILFLQTGNIIPDKVSIFNNLGELVYECILHDSSFALDLNFLPPGIYYASLHVNQKKYTRKFTISK